MNEQMLELYWDELIQYCKMADVSISNERPILIDKFLQDAIEIDVDAVSDRDDVYIAGIMEHIEEAGVHSGDSSCVLPPVSLSDSIIDEIKSATRKLAFELDVLGLMNVQYALHEGKLYVLEVNPRASRTVPFVSKVTSIPVAKVATKVILGKKLKELGITHSPELQHVGVKSSVFPWARFPGTDTVLGPEMKSTGEVMGIDTNFPMAFAKSQLGAGMNLPVSGKIFISVKNDDKRFVVNIARDLYQLGFELISTEGTALVIMEQMIPVMVIKKVYENQQPNIIDHMIGGLVKLVINTPSAKSPKKDEVAIRQKAVALNIPLITTMAGARAAVEAIKEIKTSSELSVKPLQEFHDVIG